MNKDVLSIKDISKYILYLIVFLFPLSAGGNTWFGFGSTTGIFLIETMIAIAGLMILGFYNGLFEAIRGLSCFQWLVFLSALIYLAINIISMFLSISTFKSEGLVFVYISAVILFFSFYVTFDKADINTLLILLVVACVIVSGIGIYQTVYWFPHLLAIYRGNKINNPDIINLIKSTFRAMGTFEHPNVMAGFLLMIIPSTYLFVIEKQGYSKYLFSIPTFLITLGLFITYSRAGIFLYALSLPFIFLVLRKRFSFIRILLPIAVIAVLAGVSSGIIISTYSSHNKQTLINKYSPSKLLVTNNMSFIARENYDISALRVIKHNLWIGTGPGTYGIAVRRYQAGAFYSKHAHNNYLELTSEIGVFGLIAYLLFIIGIFILLIQGLKQGSLPAGMILVSMGSFAVHTAVDFDYSSPAIVWVLFLYGAIALLLGRRDYET